MTGIAGVDGVWSFIASSSSTRIVSCSDFTGTCPVTLIGGVLGGVLASPFRNGMVIWGVATCMPAGAGCTTSGVTTTNNSVLFLVIDRD
jgi:hypothetical protein